MADIWSKAKRSEVMARIRGKGNRTTEVRLAALFRVHGITGWRRQYPLPGRPDFAFPARRLAVFVDGCFWHGCPRHGTSPKGNARFWRKKIARNRERDREVNRQLRRRSDSRPDPVRPRPVGTREGLAAWRYGADRWLDGRTNVATVITSCPSRR